MKEPNKVKVSVLVPVHDVQDFLPKCIGSILEQTYGDFELILVDDGSNDDSGTICDQYAQQDLRVRVFHQSNQGISATRELALQQAQGEYVMWVDSDDWIEPDMMEQMVQSAEQTQSDIVGCNLDVIWKDTIWKVETTATALEDYTREMVASQWTVLWRHLFRRSVLLEHDIHFPAGINNGEDYYFVNRYILRAKSISFVNAILYHYNRLNYYSTMSTISAVKTMEQINATKLIVEDLRSLNLYHQYKSAIDFRKYIAKEPLWKQDRAKWFSVFPEVSFMKAKAWLGNIRNHFVCLS